MRERERERERERPVWNYKHDSQTFACFIPRWVATSYSVPLALWHPLSERASPTSPRRPPLSLSLLIFTLSIRTLTVKSVEFQVCVKIFVTDNTLFLLLLSITWMDTSTFIHLIFFIHMIFILMGHSCALMLAGRSRHSLSRTMQRILWWEFTSSPEFSKM